ncbi:hypothetical protein OUZ56_021535 [Daphnia magna]|uniref:Uncharacterized protein n=1 Tax=Daphnia magna TaxID=35525 RepID=A0ABQ9ZHN0_9CRUS|nr:hypothetical protein OUZ56_021535 [Daphnia magna]
MRLKIDNIKDNNILKIEQLSLAYKLHPLAFHPPPLPFHHHPLVFHHHPLHRLEIVELVYGPYESFCQCAYETAD